MPFDREAARKDGYTDQEIDQYIANKDNPPETAPPEATKSEGMFEPMFASPETLGTAQFGAGQAAKYLGEGALGYGAYRGVKSIAQNFARPPATPPTAAPVAPAPMEPGGQNVKDFTTQQGRYAPPAQPGMMDRFGQLAQQYAPILSRAAPLVRGLGAVGAATYSPGLNAGEEEALIRIRARQEAARKAGLLP